MENSASPDFEGLYSNYALYNTREQRAASSAVLAQDPEKLAGLLEETLKAKARFAPTDAATLLQFASDAVVEKPLIPLINAQAALLSQCLDAPRDRLAASCIAHTRRSIGLSCDKNGPKNYLSLLDSPDIPALTITSLLADVANATPSTYSSEVGDSIDKWVKGFNTLVLGAKTMPNSRTLSSFAGFLRIIPQNILDESLVPAITRSLLRAAEAVLEVFPQIIMFLPKELNFDKAAVAFQSSLISSMSSSNTSIRQMASRAIGIVLDRSQAIALAVIQGFTKSTGELRGLYAQILLHVSVSDESAIKAVDTVANKETSEVNIGFIVQAAVHFRASDIIARGCGDKRAPLRREWVCAAATALNDLDDNVRRALENALNEVVANPISAIASKFLAAGYAATAALKSTAGKELLLDPKVYERISTPLEYQWAMRSLSSIACPEITDALVYITSTAPPGMRIDVHDTLLHVYKTEGVPCALATSLETSQRVDNHLITVFGTPVPESSRALAKVLVISHKTTLKNGWTGLCLKACTDPGKIVETFYDDMLESIWKAPKTLVEAANSALATIAFVRPDLTAPKVADFIRSQLKYVPINSDDALIYSTPPDQLAMTTEVSKKKASSDSNRKSDLAWDEQVRQELAKKNAKLSPEDKKILEEQGEVRVRVGTIVSQYLRAISAINSLSDSTLSNGINFWFPVAVEQLLKISKISIIPEAATCLSGLSRNISSRFENVRPKVGKALLWRLNLGGISSNETLNEVLYRAKFLADQQPLDQVSLVYTLPILIAIIKDAANPKKITDELDEQLLLALNIIATEADELNTVPRQDLIVSLITLLEKNRERAKDVKDCLQRVAQGVVFDQEEQSALLRSTVSPNSYVRVAALEVIDSEVDLRSVEFSPEVFIERFGEEAHLASTIWEESEMTISENALEILLEFIGYEVRNSVAKAIEYVVVNDQSQLQAAITRLTDYYSELREPPTETIDEWGLKVKSKARDPWQERSGILKALNLLVPLYTPDQILFVANFVAASAVSDPTSGTVTCAHDLGLQVVEVHGAHHLDQLLPLFGKFIESENENEDIRQAHVLLYGMEARHLPHSDPRLANIVEKLIGALQSTSEKVQFSVSQCLVPLAKRIDPHHYFESLLGLVFTGETSVQRKGAAYGIAGLTKGIGISALSDYGVIRAITEGSEDKKDIAKREGAQFAIDCLSLSLGKFFEPYALELLPTVLSGLGDNQIPVRHAATGAARTIMKHTTGYGIKLQIPTALNRMNDTAWRAKKGAVELLGTMAYLDPQQLSASLSTVIPEIVAVLGDSHKEVRAAAKGSLHSFGEVIKNPEIHQLVPVLLDAISDPTKNTEAALDALLKTKFVHYIDSPSLAIVIHVLKRGLRDRSANTKRRACQVVGNMSILTEQEDLIPYLPEIMPDLQVAMVDPVPATSATACKALGVLVEKLGEDTFPQVIPDMLESLKDEKKISDRWGVAQGLSEVIHGLGINKLEELLPVILRQCASPKPWVRQGFIPLLMFLPASFGQAITPYLGEIIPSVLQGLADTLDDVRENALKAGRRIVRSFASKAVDLLLPELELGLSDPNYRIRLSSVELTGDLLFQLSGVSRSSSEDTTVSSRVQTVLVDILGAARRDRILALLFVCRADVVGAVRTSALEVWMTLVANTPRTVKEILPTLTQILVKKLSVEDEELQKIAARALGELVRRVNGALAQILPTFKELATDPESKEGICIGLMELIQCTPFDVLKENEHEITSLIRSCLTDLNDSVREAASQAFDALQEALGEVAQDILPELIAQMEQGDDGAFAALKEMMSTSPEVVFPALLPKLLSSPMTPHKASSLADICEVAGEDLYKRIDSIVDFLLDSLVSNYDEEVADSLTRILLNHAPLSYLLSVLKNSETAKRCHVLNQLATVFSEDHEQIDMLFIPDFVSFAIISLEDSTPENVQAAFNFLQAVTSSITKPQLAELVEPAHKALSMTSVPLAGFQLPKGVSCVLPIFLQGLVLGSNKDKEASALAIADVVYRTEPDNFKTSVTAITGPLIRVVGEKYPAEVKSAILFTLNVLLKKIPQFLKPFLPQLQRTFAKCLADPSSSLLRNRAARALGTLITLQPRLEPLVKEIISGIESSTDAGVSSSMLRALFEITSRSGETLADTTKENILRLVLDTAESESDIRQLALLAKIGAIMLNLVGSLELVGQFQAGTLFSLLTMNSLLVYSPNVVKDLGTEFVDNIISQSKNHNSDFSENGVSALGKYVLGDFPPSESAVSALIDCVAKGDNRSPDTRRLSLIALRGLARQKPLLLEPKLDSLIVPLFASVRDTSIPVKLAAENTFLDVFRFVESGDSAYFNKYFEGAKDRNVVPKENQRSLEEYVRRIAMRHAVSRREQIESGTTDNDMGDDLDELWSVGYTTELES